MKYNRWYKELSKIIGIDLAEVISKGNPLTLRKGGYMDLKIDILENNRIAMAHNYIQEGDVMADPDMEIGVDIVNERIFPLTYQQSSLGLYQEIYSYDEAGEIVGVRLKLRNSIESFFNMWLRNIKNQGHKLVVGAEQ